MRFLDRTQGKELTTDDKRRTSHDGYSTITITSSDVRASASLLVVVVEVE